MMRNPVAPASGGRLRRVITQTGGVAIAVSSRLYQRRADGFYLQASLQLLDYADCPEHPAWIESAEWLGNADHSQGELFHLISRQPKGRLHSQLNSEEASLKDKKAGREQVLLSPEAAARLRIKDGDTVRLFNVRGQCLATACVT